ncbi:MAG: hypothetical protein DRI77_11470 [Chloroflexi bacterium]|nr:MAG: hypothetical protein DRI77_11470 [Chloroflexota bacterium]
MSLYYFDASALVKQYVQEPGSTWIRRLIDRVAFDKEQGNTVFIAEVNIVKVAAALAILARTNKISLRDRNIAYQRFMDDTAHLYQIISMETSDFHSAAHLTQRHPLKAYDAIHLAIALRHHHALARYERDLIFVSGDRQQLEAAAAEGLATDNPFDHPSPPDSPTP